jgi:cell division septation protein DedD
MKDRAIPLTRGQLLALGAMSLALAALSFFVGLAVGQGAPASELAAANKPSVPPLVAEAVQTGSLESLLVRVSGVQATEVDFPGALAAAIPHASADGVPLAGWAVQVAEYPDAVGAERLVAQLRELKLPAYAVSALVDGTPQHRVRVGGFSTRESATAAVAAVATSAGSSQPLVVPAP